MDTLSHFWDVKTIFEARNNMHECHTSNETQKHVSVCRIRDSRARWVW